MIKSNSKKNAKRLKFKRSVGGRGGEPGYDQVSSEKTSEKNNDGGGGGR